MADMIVEKERSSSGPIAAVVTILVLLLLGYLAWQYFGGMNTDTRDTTDINVTTPSTESQTPAEDTQTPATTEETPTTEETTPPAPQ